MKKYFIAILCCQSRMEKMELQKKKYLNNIESLYPDVEYYYFIGNPNQNEKWIINKEKKLITLKCPDDYLNLPQKTHCVLEFVKNNYPNIKGVFKTDDDIVINMKELYLLLDKYKNVPYWGKRVDINWHRSHYIQKFRKQHAKHLPIFLRYPIIMRKCTYCAGGGYYLRNDIIDKVLKEKRFITIDKNLEILKYHFRDQCIRLYVHEDFYVGCCLYEQKPSIKATDIPEIRKAVVWPGVHKKLPHFL